MNNNLAVLRRIKAEIGQSSQEKFISQEEVCALISEKCGVQANDIQKVFNTLMVLTADRLKNNEDVLIPGIMRLTPGEGGHTRRYIKIKSISRYLKERLK